MSKFLNADDTVDLIKSGVGALDLDIKNKPVFSNKETILGIHTSKNISNVSLYFIPTGNVMDVYYVDWGDGTTSPLSEGYSYSSSYVIQHSYDSSFENKEARIKIYRQTDEVGVLTLCNNICSSSSGSIYFTEIVFSDDAVSTNETTFNSISLFRAGITTMYVNTIQTITINKVNAYTLTVFSLRDDAGRIINNTNNIITVIGSETYINNWTGSKSYFNFIKYNLTDFGNQIAELYGQLSLKPSSTDVYLKNQPISNTSYIESYSNIYNRADFANYNNDSCITKAYFEEYAVSAEPLNVLKEYNGLYNSDIIKIHATAGQKITMYGMELQHSSSSDTNAQYDIDWGDGSERQEFYFHSGYKNEHTYTNEGDYYITFINTTSGNGYIYPQLGNSSTGKQAVEPETAVLEVYLHTLQLSRYVFQNCVNLTKVVFDENWEYDSYSDITRGSAFNGCTALKSVFILNKDAFLDNTALPSNSFPQTCNFYILGNTTQYPNITTVLSHWTNNIYGYNLTDELSNKLSTTGGSLTGDVTTTNTTFTNTSLVTKQYVDDTIANLNANATQY